tara:strand:+ start:5390 stop:5905 length:516 start_codon:yes stop_codon:yes gene_type:complete
MKISGDNGYVRDVKQGDIMQLASNPRSVDLRHSKYLGWDNYQEHVLETFYSSRRSLSFCFKDDTLVGCIGVHDSPHERVGGIWALGSPDSIDVVSFKGKLQKTYGTLSAIKGAFEFMKISRECFDWMYGEEYDHLVNIVENKNKLGIRWLKFLGGKISKRDDKFSQVTFSK